ncbi:MAG: S8 family peptidase [Lachnospiraceae bacterium]|nr:S8 family peptidase [Lachnospiraceae bacterium]
MDMNRVGEGIPPNNCKERILSNDYADYIVSNNGDADGLRSFFQGECVKVLDDNLALVNLERLDIDLMTVITQLYYMVPKCYGPMDTTSMEESGILKVQNQPVLSLRGRKILVGIIDTGIDYRNPLFQYEDGSTRIKAIWDQTIQSGQPPEGLEYGSEYSEAMINQALQSENPLEIVPSVDTNGHGTFVSGIIAGGKDEDNDFTGAAPQAELVVVKLKQAKEYLKEFYAIDAEEVYQETDIMMAIHYMRLQAAKFDQSICIYLGMGTNSGDHAGKGALSEYLNRVNLFPGFFVAVPVGNEGNARHHYYGRVDAEEDYHTVEINVGAEESGFVLELWGETPYTYAVGLESPFGEIIERVPPNFLYHQDFNFLLEGAKVEISYVLVEELSGKQLIFLRFQNPTEGIWRIRVYATGNGQNEFHMWLPIREFVSDNTFFLEPEPDTTLTEPSSAEGPTGTTAYNHTTDSLYIEAGRGYTTIGGIKPDITAPGVNVYGPSIERTPDGNYRYTRRSGTSIATAHVVGAAALLMEWAETRADIVRMNGVKVKRYLIRGANRRTDLNYPNPQWGYGTLDLYGTFQQLQQPDFNE